MTLVVALSPEPILQFFGDDGTFLVGGQLFTSVGGIPYPTYADSQGLIQHANPIILNSRGEIATSSGQSAQLFLIPNVTYSFALFDAQSNPIDTPSSIQGIPTAATIEQLITSTFIGEEIYPQTATEASQNVAPTIFIPALRFDPTRYGAVGDGIADDTIPVQTALNIAFANSGCVWLPDNLTFLCGALSLTMANSAAASLRIEGASVLGSVLMAKGGLIGTPFITFASPAPASTLIESFLTLANFSVASPAISTNVHGISLQGLASWQLHNVRVQLFHKGLDLQNSLIGIINEGCEFVNNNTGIGVTTLSPTSCINNLIRVRDCRINGNLNLGVDYDGGSQLQMYSNDIETNGTVGNTATGGVRIRGGIGAGVLEASVALENNWFEGNHGWSFFVEANTVSATTIVSLRGGEMLSSEAGQAIKIAGASLVSIEDIQSQTPGDIYDITAGRAYLKNVFVSSLLDTNIAAPTYVNVQTGTKNMPNGRTDNFPMTLTNVSGTVTGTVNITEQGDQIFLQILNSITGAAGSNTSPPVLTGMPSAYWPVSDADGVMIVQDAGVNTALPVSIAAANGNITIGIFHTFSGSSNKGVVGGSITYKS